MMRNDAEGQGRDGDDDLYLPSKPDRISSDDNLCQIRNSLIALLGDSDTMALLHRAAERYARVSRGALVARELVADVVGDMYARALVTSRVGPSDRYALYKKSIRDFSPGTEVIQVVLPIVIEAVVGGTSGSDVEADLDVIRHSHCDGVHTDYLPPHRWHSLKTNFDIKLALRICKAAMEYPVQLVTLAQERVQSGITFRPVLSVAEDDAWFE